MLRVSDLYEAEAINYDSLELLKFKNIKKFFDGTSNDAYKLFGAHASKIHLIDGVLFVVWAPRADKVAVIGDFNQWDERVNYMCSYHDMGIWVLFIPDIPPGSLYKYAISAQGKTFFKTDPYARAIEKDSNRASIVEHYSQFVWHDQNWLSRRRSWDWQHSPISVYEVHLGSWKKHNNGTVMSFRELTPLLVEYVIENGFTHIELMPITEHPYTGSWGYQTIGFFAVTARYGEADDLRYLINSCHEKNIGVILDWTPAHFPKDDYALAEFDGSKLYECADEHQAHHPEWGTLVFDYTRNEIKSFLVSSAHYWIKEFHFDGIRVDAVASMLLLDYGRDTQSAPKNTFGGNENIAAVDFLKRFNQSIKSHFPGVLTIAEDSTNWPGVTKKVACDGLGFSLKWNMGWMHDTLNYMHMQPIHRHCNHEKITFSLMYVFNEHYMLPLSHDEVVHGKSPLIGKMSGDEWQRFATLRILYAYMYTHPGKKLVFMGNEFAQYHEWNHDESLDWLLLFCKKHKGIQHLIADLNRLYMSYPQLYYYDMQEKGFQWLNCHDKSRSVFSYFRCYHNKKLLVILNATPLVRDNYILSLDKPVYCKEILNTNNERYGGSSFSSIGLVHSRCDKNGNSFLSITLPPLAAICMEVHTL